MYPLSLGCTISSKPIGNLKQLVFSFPLVKLLSRCNSMLLGLLGQHWPQLWCNSMGWLLLRHTIRLGKYGQSAPGIITLLSCLLSWSVVQLVFLGGGKKGDKRYRVILLA